MILKKKWDAYRIIERKYYGHGYNLENVKKCQNEVHNGCVVWFYWNSGLENAPVIVKKCYEMLQKNMPEGWTVMLLTEDNARMYIELPAFVEKLKDNGDMWYPLYADLVRLSLLWHYGGIWCDATCYLTQVIPQVVLESPLFMFTYHGLMDALPSKYENWFIKADKNNYVIGQILENLLYYWSQPKKQQEYFVWFHIQTAMYENDEKARVMMDAIPYFYNYDAMMIHLHYGLDYPFSEKLWKQISNKCFVQKITYKYNKEWEHSEGFNLIQKVMNS